MRFVLTLSLFFACSGHANERYLVIYKASDEIQASSQAALQKMWFDETKKLERTVFHSISLNTASANPQTYWLLRGTILTATETEAHRIMQNSNVERILPLNRSASLAETSWSTYSFTYGLNRIRIPEFTQLRPNIRGKNIRVGIIDTGIDANHPDLRGKTVLFRNFINPQSPRPIDDHGHGTHVAGTIAGESSTATRIGVAPEVSLYIAKAFSARGSSSDEGLLAALQWMADPDQNPETQDQVQVINNSWNLDDSPYSQMDPDDEIYCRIIQQLNLLGTTVVFAAGNDGSRSASIKLPAACPNALSVGATDSRDQIADFSSRGPVQWKSVQFVKPDVVAPGRDIRSADIGGGYRSRSGTSMAAPHAAGLVALFYQLYPDMNSETAKNILAGTAKDLGSKGIDNAYGAGLIQAIGTANSQVNAGKIIGSDDLIPVNGDGSNVPSEFVAYLDAIGWTNYGCTVTHIGRGYAFSAGHCFEAKPQLERDQSCRFVEVDWGYRGGRRSYLKSRCERIVVMQNNEETDFAILKLAEVPRAQIPVSRVLPKLTDVRTITIFSHPSGMPLKWSQYCDLVTEEDKQIPKQLLKYPCDTEGGSSGAVLLDRDSKAIIGIHKGGYPHINYGSDLFSETIQGELERLGF